MPISEIRDRITNMGESVLVVGDENLVRVHIHTHKPDIVLEYARGFGKLEDIIVDNMDEQVNKRKEMRRER
jgi:dihydroxyacetone kinase-like predicted kinase